MRAKALRPCSGWSGELVASRSFWLFLLAIGPLVGQAFLHAASSTPRRAARRETGRSAGPSPLDGIFVPAFGAYDLAVTLLYPFVAIRLVAERGERRRKLLLQSPASIAGRLGVKLAAPRLLSARVAGGAARAPSLKAGGRLRAGARDLPRAFLRFLLATAVAAAPRRSAKGGERRDRHARVHARHLGARLSGGGARRLAERAARYTPTAGLRVFEHGQLSLATAAVFWRHRPARSCSPASA